MKAADDRRRCQHCGHPMRSDSTSPYCSRCRSLKTPCPDCGRPKMLEMERCRRCHGRHNPFGRRTIELIPRTNRGRCLGVWLAGAHGGRRFLAGAHPGCSIAWGNLDHVHCNCGAPTSPATPLCGECSRRQLEEPNDGFCIRCGLESPLLFCEYCVAETQSELANASAKHPSLRDPDSEFRRASGFTAHVALAGLRL